MTMNAELKKKWIEALRSGKYEQGRGSLQENGKYCCLGVLCETANIPHEQIENSLTRNRYIFKDINETSEGCLPKSYCEMIGIPDGGDVVSQETLINMNDKQYKTFSEIADWIEANL